MISSKTFIATPPGATIKEQLFNRGMTQKEFASRMDMSEKHISRLINGEVQLTSDMAMRLEMTLGISARFWSNLESIYREKLSKVQAENEMDEISEDLKELTEEQIEEIKKRTTIEEVGMTVYSLRIIIKGDKVVINKEGLKIVLKNVKTKKTFFGQRLILQTDINGTMHYSSGIIQDLEDVFKENPNVFVTGDVVGLYRYVRMRDKRYNVYEYRFIKE